MRSALIVLGAGAVVLAVLLVVPGRFTEREVRESVFTAIEQESPEAFLITGRLDVTVTTQIENSRIILPGLVGLDLGTARATVRVPGRVSYGFAADSLRPEMIRFTDDGVIEMELPDLLVYSAEPDLAALEVDTERGWARLPSTRAEVERQAMAVIESALRRQGMAHIATSFQPRINSARALQRLLRPALQGLGMAEPAFRFRLGDDLIVEPSG